MCSIIPLNGCGRHGRAAGAGGTGRAAGVGKDGKATVVGTLGDTAELQKAIKQKDWNEYTILASGNRMIHKINGVTMSEIVDDFGKQSGILALQLHAGPPMEVQFKDIRLKRLPLASKKKAVLIAGRDSHSRGTHEHNAGCTLLAMIYSDSSVPSYMLMKGLCWFWKGEACCCTGVDC